jgi:diazepam-binding inhibitor (GABA receptor modulator, acyl-CoA-binding protein)
MDSASEVTEELTQSFQQAVATSKTTPPKELTQDQKLGLYGLYKQAEVGPCNTERPGIFDQTGRYKHDAWTKLGSMSKAEAMTKYIALVNEAYAQ